MARFSKETASKQWKLYKKHMLKRFLGRLAFREFLEDYKGSWTPDSGPIIAGGGVAATADDDVRARVTEEEEEESRWYHH